MRKLTGPEARDKLERLLPKSFIVEFRQCAVDVFEIRASNEVQELYGSVAVKAKNGRSARFDLIDVADLGEELLDAIQIGSST